ncbi:Glutathione S transferase 2-like protein, partial [Operophtera brumata]
MAKYTFSYFPIKALGEGPRLLLAYGGEEWKDNRVSPDQWPDFKPSKSTGSSGALCESPRLLLAYGGEEWKDNYVSPDQWPDFKP